MVMEEELSPHDGEELTSNIRVAIKQSPMSTNLGFVHMNKIRGLRWDNTLAGTMKRTRIFPYGFVDCGRRSRAFLLPWIQISFYKSLYYQKVHQRFCLQSIS